jgi:hypothetical protein
MAKRTKTTAEAFVESLTPKELKEFNEEYRELLLSELLIAVMERDDVSVRELAKLADLSPTVVQAMRSPKKKDFTMRSFIKILKGLGCKKFMVELNGQLIPLDISASLKK